MQRVEVRPRDIDDYLSIVGHGPIDLLRALARPLQGKRVVHVNATSVGGGVSEILRSEIPLLQGLGIDAEWWTLSGEDPFFRATKKIHNALQGHPDALTADEWAVYDEFQKRNASGIDWERVDVAMIHDPQPMALPLYVDGAKTSWIWRLHVDSSDPNHDVWSRLHDFLEPYQRTVFTMDAFVPPDVPSAMTELIAPAIDPLTPKNRPIRLDTALQTIVRIGLDPARPLLTQVARLDVWKDPWGVIDAYRMVREEVPTAQLALLGVIEALDDPEAYEVYERVRAHAGSDPHIHIFIDPQVIGQVEVGSVQTLADVVFQKSIREGFGLSVTEALWKSSPVIGGRAGGIPLQLDDNIGGYLVDSPTQAGERAIELLLDPPHARNIAARGRERVRDQFLITRLIADELRIYGRVLAERA